MPTLLLGASVMNAILLLQNMVNLPSHSKVSEFLLKPDGQVTGVSVVEVVLVELVVKVEMVLFEVVHM